MSYEDRISIATPEGVDVQLTLAGVGSRFIAAIIDQAIQWSIILAVLTGLALVGASVSGGDGADVSAALAAALFVALVFVVQFTYDVLFETLASGRTPGKRWTGLRVVKESGAPVGFVTSAIRNVLRIVDGLPGMYAVGIVAVLASKRNQRLGDMAAGTLVVRERRGGHQKTTKRQAADQTFGFAGARWGPPLEPATATWDVSAVTAEELATVRRFLERRDSLTTEARARLAYELAVRLRPKVVGPSDDQPAEAFLEDLSAAKAARS